MTRSQASNSPHDVARTGRFPKEARLLSSDQFRRVFDNRHSAADRCLIIYAAENGLPHSRLGLAVSKKVGNAVVRNRWKRQIREAFRLQQDLLPRGFDWVVLPKRGAKPEHAKIHNSLLALTQELTEKKAAGRGGSKKRPQGKRRGRGK